MAAAPTGAVTFLFTDIEGSTRLLKQLRGAYADVLGEHQRLLRAAFAAHRGYEVDTQGDSFFVAFASARNAVLAAVEGQLALLTHPWPEGVQVRVRMGLHTGQAALRDGRYTGLAVHRAARIGAAGHGGQVLVSQATQTLLEDEEGFQVVLRDLGEQRLKDLDRPVRLYQADAEGLQSVFPPLRGEAEPQQAGSATPALPRRRSLIAAAAVLLALAAAATAFVLTRGSSGGLSGIRANHVGVIDPASNEIVAEVPAGIRPGPIAAGGGAVWVGNLDGRSLTRISPTERSVVSTVPLARTPTGIAVGERVVWVAHGHTGELSRVETTFGQARIFTIGGSAFGSPYGTVTLGIGSVFTAYGDSTLARVSRSGRVLYRTLAGSQPAGILVDFNVVLVTNSGDATVERFRASTLEGLGRVSVGTRPIGIASHGGAIWVANSGDDTVTRIDPESGGPRTIEVGKEPTAVLAAAESVWVANTGDGTVSRIDPATNRVVRTIDVGQAPAGLAEADGLVWVTVQTA